MKKVILTNALLLVLFSANAQNDKALGTWFITNVEYEFAKNFIGYFELQARTQKPFQKIFYGEIKGGVTYRINKNFNVFIGFGDYRTYNWKALKDGIQTNEWRLWEQFVYTQNLGRVKFENRFRIEQEWLNLKYRNRFRYRLNLIIPLNKSKIEKGTVFVSTFDEVFFTNTAPYFMRNRIYAGLGYQATNFLMVQLGWVNQYNYALTAEGGKNNLMFTVSVRFLKANKDKNIKEELPIPTLKD
ncbi:MAG TPA: DUF2490 domain-containing protein [Chitinophagales bacterium]